MRHFFIIDGIKSKDLGLYISGSGTFDSPERDYDKVSVPGRNGDLIFDNGRYKNITLKYPAFVRRQFGRNSEAIRAWLLGTQGYRRIEDTYHPDEYRMGIYSGRVDFDVRELNTSGETDLKFDCMPQRWLKSGEEKIEITETTVLKNPTGFSAQPLIRVYGSGTITVGDDVIRLENVNGYVDIDSETENAYSGTQNMNKNIYFESGDFPVLHEATKISFSDGISKVEIKPRWWRI